jgi:hypothetical protein
MKWTKSPEWLIQAFEHGLPMAPGVERRPMFGYPCAFVHGHMFCGLHQGDLIVRLPEARRDALIAGGARIFEPTPGRPMNEYVVAPVEIVGDREALRAWLSEALEYATSLGPTEKKATKKTSVKKKAAPAKAASTKPVARKRAVKKTAARKSGAKAIPRKKAAKKAATKKPAAKKSSPRRTKKARRGARR